MGFFGRSIACLVAVVVALVVIVSQYRFKLVDQCFSAAVMRFRELFVPSESIPDGESTASRLLDSVSFSERAATLTPWQDSHADNIDVLGKRVPLLPLYICFQKWDPGDHLVPSHAPVAFCTRPGIVITWTVSAAASFQFTLRIESSTSSQN